MRKIVEWLEHRTGLETAIKNFLYEDIPASSGWHQIIGSAAVFFFIIQIFTGGLLAFNFAPTPGDSWNSVRYIMTELTGGKLIRGLHHWGASMMLIIVVLHMTQVFLYGAYKKPREATWMLGVVLLLITLVFGLTGYLLPWDNRAYWGTVVTTQITGSAPVLGPYLVRLLGSEDGVSRVTFSRFYAMHTTLLPPLLMILIGIHIYLVRKHGVAPAVGDTAPRRKFFPEQVFKDTVGVALAFIILFTLAVVAEVPLGRLADPTDTSFIPRPEWYFLFLFQTIKFFKGPMEVLGAVVLPGLAVLVLFLIPFIDRGPMVRLGKRTFAFAVAGLAAIAWTGLTTAAVMTTPPNPEENGLIEQTSESATSIQAWQHLSPQELEGLALFRKENCKACHQGAGKQGVGPDLGKMPAEHRNAAWLVPHFQNPSKIVPGSSMPPVQLKDAELNSLSAFVMKLTPENEDSIMAAPDYVVQGALVYQQNHCDSCHQVSGVGQKLGPALDGVGQRHDRAWLEQHFRDPQGTSKGTIMPPYKFSDADMDAICKYLLQLPKAS
ncbi:MAG TPA: cytochrome b N-terminal domain-containing protein [Bryobacteraceae bacterium]|nr:cytochrome b N-terminal domain-containing protein [Bryobacteraceae bacterium]